MNATTPTGRDARQGPIFALGAIFSVYPVPAVDRALQGVYGGFLLALCLAACWRCDPPVHGRCALYVVALYVVALYVVARHEPATFTVNTAGALAAIFWVPQKKALTKLTKPPLPAGAVTVTPMPALPCPFSPAAILHRARGRFFSQMLTICLREKLKAPSRPR